MIVPVATRVATSDASEPQDAARDSLRRPFLTAEWRHLAMLNYEVPAELVAPYVPRGTEIDFHYGRTYASIVGFRFLATRVLGVPAPGHRDFDEVNLRLYVRRRAADGWRRGVVFVRELVPRRAIAWVARTVYNERYSATRMGHRIEPRSEIGQPPRRVEYSWIWRGATCRVALEPCAASRPLEPDSLEHFIAEHYWGYAVQRDGGTMEYQVAHPPWRAATAERVEFVAALDALADLYGAEFAEILQKPPESAIWADGSAVSVFAGRRV